MAEDSENVINFESILKNSNIRKQQLIYTKEVASKLCSKEHYTPKDVLSNVSKQLNALQRADGIKSYKNRLRLMNVVKPALEPVNLLFLDSNRPPQSYHKFETQGVSDTQLINIVVNAEILATPKGATQEFENSFSEHHIEEKKNLLNVSPVIATRIEPNLVVHKAPDSMDSKLENVPSTSKICNDKEKQNTHSIGEDFENNEEDPNSENSITLSPIIGHNKLQLPETSQSLIYTLDAFENFETLAFPVIEQNPDVNLAKAIINSQIIDKELCITCVNATIRKERSKSPILTNRILGNTKNNEVDFNRIDKEQFKEPDKVINDIIETKLKKSFEEDIFCSDEEYDEDGNFIKLPETCRLENSLTNPSNISPVLDKTMYVGFQTASNKSIQIHTDTFCKAKNILDDLDLDDDHNNPTIMELVELCDDTSKNQSNDGVDIDKPASVYKTENLYGKEYGGNILKTNTNTSCATKKLNLTTEQINFYNKLDDGDFKQVVNKPTNTKDCLIGFKTASSKKINLSDKALARCRQVFQDIDINEIFDTNEPITNSCSTIHKAVDIDGTSKIKTQCNNNKDQNESLEVSEQIALSDQTILQEFENDLIAPPINDLQKKQHNKSENPIENKNKGFNKNMIEDIKSKEKLSKSNSDKLHIKHKIVDINKEKFVGFKTANNKKIKISEHALAKTKNIFEDLNLFNEVDNDENINREKESHKNKDANDQLNQDINEEISSDILLKNSVNIECNTACGFITASKKPIAISSEAMIKSKKILEDIDSCIKSERECETRQRRDTERNDIKVTLESNSNMCNQFKIPNTNQMKISDNIHTRSKLNNLMDEFVGSCKAKINYQSKEIITNQFFKGFQTASNKKVKVSSKSLAASKKLFEYLQISDNFNETNMNERSHPIIQTKFDNIQTESENFRNLPKEMQITEQDFAIHQGFNGFRSASNKLINVSEQALVKSKNLFLDLDL
ncbi:PREDICTED: reticulocyte-binding protein 2-like, partial [Papilio xuthus]|uniref:Reticulocyte-binding protein 2-like n=1 Tax=Papilio xuthus TaxID=66420 RepID=A0AAJ7EHD3_PAPXU